MAATLTTPANPQNRFHRRQNRWTRPGHGDHQPRRPSDAIDVSQEPANHAGMTVLRLAAPARAGHLHGSGADGAVVGRRDGLGVVMAGPDGPGVPAGGALAAAHSASRPRTVCALAVAVRVGLVGKSRMRGDAHVRICERTEVGFPRATRLCAIPWGRPWDRSGKAAFADAGDARSRGIRRRHSVCWAAPRSGGLESLSARARSAISESGGNASPAGVC